MKVLELVGKKRENTGKKDSKQLRTEELIPCVIYGAGENVHFSIPAAELRSLVYTPHVYILSIDIDGKKYNAILKDLQFHGVTDDLLHIDFLQIDENKKVVIEIPVVLEGFAEGVKAGGKLATAQRKLKVRAFMKDLPDTLTVDVTNLKLGATMKVRDLTFENLELLNSGNSVVAAVKLTRAAKGAMAAAATGK